MGFLSQFYHENRTDQECIGRRKSRIDLDTAALITTPILMTDPEDEQFLPHQSRQLANLVPGRADLIAFTAEEGANYHC